MMEFKNQTIYFGESLTAFNAIRDLLDENHIRYKHKIHNSSNAFMSPGSGISRSLGGNNISFVQNRYEILVSKKDKDHALFLAASYRHER